MELGPIRVRHDEAGWRLRDAVRYGAIRDFASIEDGKYEITLLNGNTAVLKPREAYFFAWGVGVSVRAMELDSLKIF